MADQMTPAELRAAAGFAARQIPSDDIEADNLRALAGAARRLADPVTLGKLAWDAVHAHGAFARDFPDEAYYRAVGEAIAHGEVRDVS